MAEERLEVRKDIHLSIFGVFVVMQAGAVGDIRVSEVELNFVILAHSKTVHGQINSVFLKFNFA